MLVSTIKLCILSKFGVFLKSYFSLKFCSHLLSSLLCCGFCPHKRDVKLEHLAHENVTLLGKRDFAKMPLRRHARFEWALRAGVLIKSSRSGQGEDCRAKMEAEIGNALSQTREH